MNGTSHVFDAVPGLAALALDQSGIVRRDQLAALGISPQHVAQQIRALRWRAVGSIIVVLHTGQITRRQRLQAAILHAGQQTGLAAWSGLEVHGLTRWERDEVHLLAGRDARVAALPGLVVHYSRRFDADAHLVQRSGLPVTPAARAALDAASWTPRRDTAIALLIAVVQQGLTTPSQLQAELLAAGSVQHARAMREHLGDIAGGVESLGELRLTPILLAAGLPRPRRAVPRIIDGRRSRLDVEVDLPDGSVLVIEVDGPDHDDVRARSNDTVRDLDNLADGRATVRVTPWALRHQAPRLRAKFQEIRLAAEARRPPTRRVVGGS